MFDSSDSRYNIPGPFVDEIVAAEFLEGPSDGSSIQDLKYVRAFHDVGVKIGCFVVPSVQVAVPVPCFYLCDL